MKREEQASELKNETEAKAGELSLHKVNARIYLKYSLFIRFDTCKMYALAFGAFDEMKMAGTFNETPEQMNTEPFQPNCVKCLRYL